MCHLWTPLNTRTFPKDFLGLLANRLPILPARFFCLIRIVRCRNSSILRVCHFRGVCFCCILPRTSPLLKNFSKILSRVYNFPSIDLRIFHKVTKKCHFLPFLQSWALPGICPHRGIKFRPVLPSNHWQKRQWLLFHPWRSICRRRSFCRRGSCPKKRRRGCRRCRFPFRGAILWLDGVRLDISAWRKEYIALVAFSGKDCTGLLHIFIINRTPPKKLW